MTHHVCCVWCRMHLLLPRTGDWQARGLGLELQDGEGTLGGVEVAPGQGQGMLGLVDLTQQVLQPHVAARGCRRHQSGQGLCQVKAQLEQVPAYGHQHYSCMTTVRT